MRGHSLQRVLLIRQATLESNPAEAIRMYGRGDLHTETGLAARPEVTRTQRL